MVYWQWYVVTMLLAAPLAGCLSQEPDGMPTATTNDKVGSRPTVVALLDSGIEVYHEIFQSRPGGPRAEDHAVAGATVVELTREGDLDARLTSDEDVWKRVVQPGELYAFAGTRVLGISFLEEGDPAILNPDGPWVRDPHGHGTSTASMVAFHDPDALIVMLQVHPAHCVLQARLDCWTHESVAKAMAWAAEQPWIDVITVSIGFPGNHPDHPDLHPEMRMYLEASRKAHESGKILLNGAGNTIVPPLTGYFQGPPWIIAVGGVEVNPRGARYQVSQQTDVVTDYSALVAIHETLDDWRWRGGTSFSSPIVAATLSKALREVRDSLEPTETAPGALTSGLLSGVEVHFTSRDFRDALNRTGIYYETTDWDPTKRPTNNTYTGAEVDELTVPILVPFVQMGWGYVNATMASEIAMRVLSGDRTMPPDKAAAAMHQETWQSAREAYWAQFV